MTSDKATALPPGFTAEPADAPWDAALQAALGDPEPGTLFHAPMGGVLDAAVILTPERFITDETALRLVTLCVRNALAAAVPPELPMTTEPGVIAINGGTVATAAVAHGPALPDDDTPAWLVLGFTVRIALRLEAPGVSPWLTDLAEEGIDVTGDALLASVCRHLLSGIDLWSAEGEPGITRAWHAVGAMQAA